MDDKRAPKQFPRFEDDAAAERFVDEADLSEYDFSQFRPMNFEYEKKSSQINLRISEVMLEALKARAKARGIPYQRFIREVLEKALNAP